MIKKQKLREATDHNQGEETAPGWRNLLTLTAMAIGLVLLWLTSRVSYLLFHSLVEAFSVLVAWGIFIVAWNTRRYTAHGYFLFLGVASLGVGPTC
jgi:high-affinity Fe2+/Pb2+ permease